MENITQLSSGLQKLLTETADAVAQATGFVKRKRIVTGADFVQGLVFGLMAEPNATRHQLHIAYNRNSSKAISAEGLDQRFTHEAVEFLKNMVENALQIGIKSRMGTAFGVLGKFKGVYVLDGTKVNINGNQQHLLTRLNLSTGEMLWQHSDQRHHENHFALTHAPLPPGALRLADLGFFHLDTFAQLNREGVYWLTRYKARTTLYDQQGQALDLVVLLQTGAVNCPVWVGKHHLPAWLVAQPVPAPVAQKRQDKHRHRAQRKQKPVSTSVLHLAAWTIYLTSIPDLDFAALDALAHARWQIERVFKLWKSFFRLPEARSHQPIRLLCLFWAKLLAILIAHWLIALDPRTFPQRSLWQSAQVVQSFAFVLLDALSHPAALRRVLRRFQATLARVARLSKRGSHKLSFQLLA
jgi:hypothetical protein